MPKVIRRADCGNSPKNLLVEALAIALETSNSTRVGKLVSDDVRWLRVGHGAVIDGKESVRLELSAPERQSPLTVTIEHVLSHGKSGACSGTVTLAADSTSAFCHVFEFASAKGDRVAAITSFIISTEAMT